MEQEQSTPNQSNNMQEEAPMRLLKIKTLTETTYELKVPADMSIKDLKVKVQELSGVPVDRQRMISMGQQLQDAKTVGDYDVSNQQLIVFQFLQKISYQKKIYNQNVNQQDFDFDKQISNLKQFLRFLSESAQIFFKDMKFKKYFQYLLKAKELEQPNWIHLVAKPQNAPNNTQPTAQQQQTQNTQQQPQQQAPRNIDMFGGNVQIQTGSIQDLSQIIGNITNLFGGNRQQQQNPLPQQQQQQQQSSINLNQTSNNQSSSNQQPQQRSNLLGHQQPISLQRQIQLPHQELLNLGLICNNLMGPQSSFPGPPLPQLPNRNTGALIGSYLSNWQFQVQRTLPFVHRLSELLQREHYMTQAEDRSSTQALSLEVGRALNELVQCTQPLVGILRDLQLNQLPGTARIEQNPNAQPPVLTRPPPQHPMQQNTQNNQPNQAQRTTTTSSSTGGQSQNTVTQTFSQPNVQATIQVTSQPITSLFQPNLNVNPQRPQPQSNQTQNSNPSQNPQAQQQPNQATINVQQTTNPNSNNPLNDLISQISGGGNGELRIGVMNQSLDNDQEIQIVGIGQTHVVDADSNLDLQSVINNIMGQVGGQNANISINNIRQNNQQNNNQQNNPHHQGDDDWEDDEEDAPLGIEVSSTINLNGLGNNNNILQSLLSGFGLPNQNINANSNINNNSGNINMPQVSTTTISGSQAANLLAQLNRQQQQFPPTNSQQQQPQQNQQNTQNNSQSNQPQQSQPQQPQQQQQPQIQMMMGGQNGGFNPLSMLMGGGLGGLGGLGDIMNMTVDEIIRENMSAQESEEQSDADELMQAIIGQLRVSDLVSSFVSGQFSFLDTIQQKIRDQITSRNLDSKLFHNNLQKTNQNIFKQLEKQFAESLAAQLSQYLIVPEQHQALVFEGIEPHMIAQDILESRLPIIYDIIFRDFPQDGIDRFSSEFVYEAKKITGELFSEISECLQGGVNDLERVFRTWVNEPIVRIMGEGTQGLVDSFITSMLWEKVKRLVLTHKHEQENNQRPAEEQKQNNGEMEIENVPAQNRGEQEIDLLEDIENELEKDQTRFDRYQNIKLSEEYQKGDFMKKHN